MNVALITFNPIRENTYIVWDDTLECAIIDAGNSNERENKQLEEFVESRSLRPVLAINTHGHFDHVLGVEFLRERYGVRFALAKEDGFLLESTPTGTLIYGMKVGAMPTAADVDLVDGESISFGTTELKVIAVPGHTPGHVALLEPNSKVLFTGDTLFKESIGRTDLPGGDYSWIMKSILERIIPLGDDITIFPGHGERSTIGHEVLYNPFIVEVINEEINYK